MEARTEYMVAGPPVAACGVVSVSMVILRLVCGKDKKMVCQIAAQDGGKNAPRAGGRHARRARDGRRGRGRPISGGALLRRKRLTQRTAPQAGAGAQKKRPPAELSAGSRLVCKWRQPTLPHSCAVPSARAGLTSLFGMGRGGTPPP